MVERIRPVEYLQANADHVGNLVSWPGDGPVEDTIGMRMFRTVYRHNLEKNISLGSDHRKHFKSIWGKPSCTWNGDFRFSIWKHELKTCTLYVRSSREKGTSYEVVLKGDRLSVMSELTTFFEELVDQLETCDA